jgi:DNA-directed RNA polymerase subunit RPC12/RpoP
VEKMVKRIYITVGIIGLLIAVIGFLVATIIFGIGRGHKGVTLVAGYLGTGLMILGGVAVVFLLIYGIYRIYFLPLHIAKSKKHPQEQAIFIINLSLGWTFLGWIIALVWAVSGEKAENIKESDLVKCPYCAEKILREAIKCKHCGSDLATTQQSYY